jgi:uncharacterized protein
LTNSLENRPKSSSGKFELRTVRPLKKLTICEVFFILALMKERIIITGYSGSLAQITKELLKDDYEIIGLTSNKEKVNNKDIYFWNTSTNEIDEKALENCKHIIHLAGYPILKRWTKKNKRLMHQSRIGATNILFNTCKNLNISPKTFISASAIGIYGLNARGVKSENDKIGNDWIARMVSDWEESAQKF